MAAGHGLSFAIKTEEKTPSSLALFSCRKPLIATVEKQLLGEHLTATLQKGKNKRKNMGFWPHVNSQVNLSCFTFVIMCFISFYLLPICYHAPLNCVM